MKSSIKIVVAAVAAATGNVLAADVVQKVNPPIAQFWMDAATHSMSMPGMEEMEDNPMMGMLGNVFGGAKGGMGSPGKWLDEALFTKKKPAGTDGTHSIPQALRMSPTLPLLPVEREKPTGGKSGEDGPVDLEKPKGRMLFYWGCSETVLPGQPRIIDFAKATMEDYSKFMVGRFAPDRGAKAIPGRSVWPNKKDSQRVPRDGSLVGDHALAGDGVPAEWRFAVGNGHDFMGKVKMSAAGDVKASIPVSWQGIETARGYFLSAMGGGEGKDGGADMIIWSSSSQPDPGWGLMDYLSPSKTDQLIKEKVVLPADTRKCDIPKGIFADASGAMVRMIAYGPELNLAHPPRPVDPKEPWNPDWAVRLRLKSSGMTMLGGEAETREPRSKRSQEATAEEKPTSSPLKELTDPVNVLKGLFGR